MDERHNNHLTVPSKIFYFKRWRPKADLGETSKLHGETLLNSSVKNFIIFTLFRCSELILLLPQKFAHLLNVFCILYFVSVVFLHAANIIACASDKIDVVDETGLELIEPTSEVSDRVDVSLVVPPSLRYCLGNEYRWWDCKFHDPYVNHDHFVQSGAITTAFLNSSWIFCSTVQMMLKRSHR